MKIDFDARLLPDGAYYITEREAEILCKLNDPKRIHIPTLPKYGWERKIIHEKSWYWLAKRTFNGGLLWCLREVD